MITAFLQRWRQAERDKMINKILIKRAGLRAELKACQKLGYAGIIICGQLGECEEILRQLGYKEDV